MQAGNVRYQTRAHLRLNCHLRKLFGVDDTELLLAKLAIESITPNELPVGTLLDHATFVKNKDEIAIDNGRQPVGNHERSPAAHQFSQCGLNDCLGARVEI